MLANIKNGLTAYAGNMADLTGSPMFPSAEKEGFKKSEVAQEFLHCVID